MTKQKKPKVGDTVGWVVVNRIGQIYHQYDSRSIARNAVKYANTSFAIKPYRVARIVLDK